MNNKINLKIQDNCFLKPTELHRSHIYFLFIKNQLSIKM